MQTAGPLATEALLSEIVGLRFLEYVLNADDAAIRAHFQGVKLAAPRDGVLAELVAVLGQLIPDPNASPFLVQTQLDALGTFDPAVQMSYSSGLRLRCGGTVDAGTSTDSVVSRLRTVARDMYPLFLLPVPGGPVATPFAPSMARSLFNHPGRSLFDEAVLADPELTLLFTDDGEQVGRFGQFRSSAGRGGSVQLMMFAETLMRGAWASLTIEVPNPTLEQYLEAVSASVVRVRDAVAGRLVRVPVRVGLTGVRLPDDLAEVVLPWGQLRAAQELDRDMLPSSLVGALSMTTADGEQVVIDYSGDIVLEMDLPYEVDVGRFEVGAEWPEHLREFETVQRRIESLQLGLLLAIRREQQPLVVFAWQHILDPLAQGTGVALSDTRRTPNLTPHQLSHDEVSAWASWIADVDRGRVPGIEVAVRRTIRAAIERADPADALVDAVIAWENLVGSREGEPTLRVTAALAWLLEHDPETRRSRQTALKKLYALRSDVVHGNRPLGNQEARQGSRDAQSVAVDALGKLLRDQPELLQECGDSSERSLRLIFGMASASIER